MKIETMRRAQSDRGKVRLVQCVSEDPFAIFVEMKDEPVKLLRYRTFAEAAAGWATHSSAIKPLIEFAKTGGPQ